MNFPTILTLESSLFECWSQIFVIVDSPVCQVCCDFGDCRRVNGIIANNVMQDIMRTSSEHTKRPKSFESSFLCGSGYFAECVRNFGCLAFECCLPFERSTVGLCGSNLAIRRKSHFSIPLHISNIQPQGRNRFKNRLKNVCPTTCGTCFGSCSTCFTQPKLPLKGNVV